MSFCITKIKICGLLVCLCFITAGRSNAQTEPPRSPKPPLTVVADGLTLRGDSEEAISVDPNVNVKFCVAEGTLKINGWSRDEVRVFVRNGRPLAMKVLERSSDSDKPNWVMLSSALPKVRPPGRVSECLAADSVEIDLPQTASVTMEARTSGATIDTVKSVSVRVIEGSINIRNVSGGIKAETFQGDVILESSSGQISLQTTTGNIIASDVQPGSIGDLMRAKTSSGAVSLQRVSHRQIEANSISGSLEFDGAFLPGGIYNFKTSNGSISLDLAPDTSCTIAASYGFGSFDSGFPLKILTEQVSPGGKSVVATIGEGSSTLNLTTSSGRIAIRKQ
jgi:hypothetical protein